LDPQGSLCAKKWRRTRSIDLVEVSYVSDPFSQKKKHWLLGFAFFVHGGSKVWSLEEGAK
jgi:hypothetical protein